MFCSERTFFLSKLFFSEEMPIQVHRQLKLASMRDTCGFTTPVICLHLVLNVDLLYLALKGVYEAPSCQKAMCKGDS